MNPRVLILTGAGASTALGSDGVPLVMMSEWATSLIAELGYAAQLLGLREGMAGNEFEGALGRFIAFANALQFIEPLHDLGGKIDVLASPATVTAAVNSQEWMQRAHQNVSRIEMVLRRNLYDQFNQTRVDDDAAYASYSRLHDQIRDAFDDRPVFLSHVTTNFDHAIEAAIGGEAARGAEPREIRNGFAASSGGRAETWAPNLLRYGDHDGVIPILHLHGAVGWYFTEEGDSLRRRPSNDLFDERQVPALLLPNDKKDVNTFPGPLGQVWEQFKQLLQNSTHVLVLGHSLHDPHLVDALQTSEKPIAVIAYTEPDEDGSFDLDRSPLLEELRSLLPTATFIAGKFAQRSDKMDIDPVSLKNWLRDHRPRP